MIQKFWQMVICALGLHDLEWLPDLQIYRCPFCGYEEQE